MNPDIREVVKEKYGEVAKSTVSSNDKGVGKVAEAFGYSAEELSSISANANMGFSCGNPTATASLRPGEVVVDLGSVGGLDVSLLQKESDRQVGDRHRYDTRNDPLPASR